jgi:hypothetical protein
VKAGDRGPIEEKRWEGRERRGERERERES